MRREKIPRRVSYFISGIWIIQLISVVLPYRRTVSYYKLLPMSNPRSGLEQPTLIFFILASIFIFVTLYFGQKRWLVWSILNSIVFVFPSYISFFVEEISFSMWGQAFAPLWGAYVYLLGIFLNICLLVYWWRKEKESVSEQVPLSPIEYRIVALTTYIGVLSCLTPRHPVNLLLQDFFPFLTPIITLVEHSTVLMMLIFAGHLISGFWLISNYNEIVSFSKIVNFRYFVKITLVWLMLGFIISTLNNYENPSDNVLRVYYLVIYGDNVLVTFLGTISLLLFEIITWIIGFAFQPYITPLFRYLRHKVNLITSLINKTIKKLFSIPELRFAVIILFGYVLGSYLIQNELLNQLLYLWRATQTIYNIVIMLVSVALVSLAQILALNNVPKEKLAKVTCNNFIFFFIAEVLSIWERYLVYWAPYGDSPFEYLDFYFQMIILLRTLELLVVLVILFISVRIKKMTSKPIILPEH
ncbi:MAG: hypothetical protein ACTSW1_12125 [Candidatus Hodarchaeales archaeon]